MADNTIQQDLFSFKESHPHAVDRRGWMVCKVDECGKIVRSRWATLCNTHYFRGRRTGSTAKRPPAPPARTNHGYMASACKAHPASSKRGILYEHRKVFYETFGPDDHVCFWCKIPLFWKGKTSEHRTFNALCVDHLNADRADNRPENLVPSCHRCNSARGLFFVWLSKHKDDPVLAVMFTKAMPGSP
jgi:hypothetical protein